MFLGAAAVPYMIVTRDYIGGLIWIAAAVLPFCVWKIVYSAADASVYKRIEKSKAAVERIGFVAKCERVHAKNAKKEEILYETGVYAGENGKMRKTVSAEKYGEYEYVAIRYIPDGDDTCLIVRRASREAYKNQFPAEIRERLDREDEEEREFLKKYPSEAIGTVIGHRCEKPERVSGADGNGVLENVSDIDIGGVVYRSIGVMGEDGEPFFEVGAKVRVRYDGDRRGEQDGCVICGEADG
ncbi:hypothetical protein FACS1894211_11830 [Clostridia bacterium]|nr:hypothetical protein FACS1894211_11830 [Clostridia bacterium]